MNDTIMSNVKLIGKLSTGQKKRLGIIAALVKQPKLLVFDEPFSNLDIGRCLELIEIFNQYKNNSTIIITSHNLDMVAEISDSFLIMDNGIIVSKFLKSNYGSVDELKEEIRTKIIHR
jgi:ABC-2 type transport system ATP-binding protein